MTDLKTSLLINRQVPEFVREEYPKFISFLEAYYEFLDQSGYGKSKELRYISDVDESLDEFEEQFFNTFLPFIPRETAINKDILIKNILPLYLSKGSEKSYKLLFRMLFGEEIQVEYPRNNVLRASDGRWFIEDIVLFDTEIYSEYVSDGEKTIYYLPYEIEIDSMRVYVNGVLSDNYLIRKESKKLIFNTAPSENDIIKIHYDGVFDTSIFENRKLTGSISGASAIVEKISKKSIDGVSFYQFFVNRKNILGTFNSGEIVNIDVIENSETIPFSLQTLSDVVGLQIINGGSNYVIGDNLVFRGSSKKTAIAIVDDISTGNIVVVTPKIGKFGAGYRLNNEIYANNYNAGLFSAVVDAVDRSGSVTPNTITYNTDIISNYQSETISTGTFNVNNVISTELTLETLNSLGPILNVSVVYSGLSSNTNPIFVANSSILFDNVRVSDLHSLGTIKVINPGTNYVVGDQVVFTNDFYFSGQGAQAKVSSVSITGGIRFITVESGGYGYRKDYPPIMTVDSISGTNAILQIQDLMGTGAEFDFVPGDGIPGKITSVKILSPGIGYAATPIIDTTLSGDGNAIITANVRDPFVELPGRWTTSDSILSTDEIRLQGRDYYIDFSYVITSQVEFQQYKSLVKNLLNPAGFINYARYNFADDVNTSTTIVANDFISLEVAGTVNVTSNSVTVTGTNTFFNLASNIGLTNSVNIAVNSEVRVVNTIINNSTLTVTQPFTYSSNNDVITLM